MRIRIPQSVFMRPLTMRPITLLGLAMALIVSGCNTPESSVTEPATEPVPEADATAPDDAADAIASDPDAAPEPTEDTAAAPSPLLISDQGIGLATLGLTLDDLKATLGADVTFVPQTPFIVDFDAIAVREGEETLFYLIHLAGDPLQGDDIIQGILTTNPRYQTVEGVGVGTSIAEAEAIYGEATLSHNLDNESREYVRFEQHPSTNISFATQVVGEAATDEPLGFSGIYPDSAAQYQETPDYEPDAAIEGVLLVCLTESCTQGE